MLGKRDTDYRDIVRRTGTVLSLRAGDTVFREGDPATTMYVLLSGELAIVSHGREIEVLAPGQALGIVSLLDGEARTTTARARGDAQVAVLDQRAFRILVEDVPGFVWYVMGELAHRLRATNAVL